MLKTSSTSIKQQPYSPVSYNSYSNNLYPYHHHHHHHHRQSTMSPDAEQSSSTLNRNSENLSTNNVKPASVTVDEGGGWYTTPRLILHSFQFVALFSFCTEYKYFVFIYLNTKDFYLHLEGTPEERRRCVSEKKQKMIYAVIFDYFSFLVLK